MKASDYRVTRDEAETVVVATIHDVVVYTTLPHHWRALRRRAARLGGKIDTVHKIGKREVGGVVIFPASAFSLARFGLRASPSRAKENP